MALNQRLELRQGQSLVMTPQLQQAIKLLQMSNIELQAFVEGELERNPLLERDERSDAPKPEAQDAAAGNSDMVQRTGRQRSRRRTSSGPSIPISTMSTPTRRGPMPTTRESLAPADSGWASLRPSGGLVTRQRRA